MVNAIIMNTTLFDKSIPLAGNVSLLVKANSSIIVTLSQRDINFLTKSKLVGIRVSLSPSVEHEIEPIQALEELDEQGEGETILEPLATVEPELKVSESKPFDLDALDEETLRDLCNRLGIKVRSNTSIDNIKSKLSGVEVDKITELLK